MPRYYCDYCDTYLTHDSPSVRKQHNAGYKHKANIRSYYQKFEEQQTQILIDQKIKEHLGQTGGYHQIGAAYNQHLAAFPAGRPRLPVLPPPFGVPGSIPPHMIPGMRPPILPLPVPGHPGPVPGHPGYGNSQMIPMQPMHASSMPQQNSGALPPPPPPPSTGIPSPVPGGGQPPSSSGTQLYNVNPPGTPASTATAGGFSYPQSSQTGH